MYKKHTQHRDNCVSLSFRISKISKNLNIAQFTQLAATLKTLFSSPLDLPLLSTLMQSFNEATSNTSDSHLALIIDEPLIK
jgi:hypothetical protein